MRVTPGLMGKQAPGRSRDLEGQSVNALIIHAFAEAAQWFNHWHVYRSIVDNDWMGHRGRRRPRRCARWPAKQGFNSPHVNEPVTPQGSTDFLRS